MFQGSVVFLQLRHCPGQQGCGVLLSAARISFGVRHNNKISLFFTFDLIILSTRIGNNFSTSRTIKHFRILQHSVQNKTIYAQSAVEYSVKHFSNSYVHFGTLHCSGFLACISTITVEETAFQIVQKGLISSDCKDGPVKPFSPPCCPRAAGILSALTVAAVISISPHPCLTWCSSQQMCPIWEIPLNCPKPTRAFRINLLAQNNCMELIQAITKPREKHLVANSILFTYSHNKKEQSFCIHSQCCRTSFSLTTGICQQ